MTFGETLAYYRKEAGMGQREAARQLGVSAGYYNDLEHDRRNPPINDRLVDIARLFDSPLVVLYYRAGRLPPWLLSDDFGDQAIIAAFDAFRDTIAFKEQAQ